MNEADEDATPNRAKSPENEEKKEPEKPVKKIMQIRLDKNQVYIVLRGVFRIERYKEPEYQEEILDEEEENSSENEENELDQGTEEKSAYGQSQFTNKLTGVMRTQIRGKLGIQGQKSIASNKRSTLITKPASPNEILQDIDEDDDQMNNCCGRMGDTERVINK